MAQHQSLPLRLIRESAVPLYQQDERGQVPELPRNRKKPTPDIVRKLAKADF